MWRGVLKEFWKGFEWKHMSVEKGACFLVDGVLKTLLCGRCSWKITDAAGGYIVLSE